MTFGPELPKGWTTTTIRQLSLPVKQVNPASLDRDAFEYIEVSGLDNEAHAISSTATTPTDNAPSRARQLVECGDIIFSSVRVYLENIAIVSEELAREIASTAFYVVRAMPGVSSRYLFHFLTWQKTIRALTERQRGNSPPAINEAEFFDYEVTLAPTAEQARIVSRIEELFSDLDTGEENLRRAQAQLKRYRQSVLKAAVTGELTRAWREQNADTLESGEALLKRILKARRAAWEKAELEKLRAKGKPPKDDAWKSRYVEPQGPNAEGLPELPEGWAWATPVQLEAPEQYALAIGPFGSNLKVSDYCATGVPLIFVRNIRAQRFSGLDDKFVSPEKARELSPHSARPGDVLITKMGDPPGDACVYPANAPPAIITADCIKWTLSPILCPAFYFSEFINSVVGRAQFAEITKGVAQQKVSLDRFRQIAIALPPLEEQRAVSDMLQTMLTSAEHIEAELEKYLAWSRALRQSILKAAFSGKLVPQDPSDEPAEELLKRIAAERAAQGARPVKSAAPRAPRKARAAKKPSVLTQE